MINLNPIDRENFYYSIAYTDDDQPDKKPKIIFSSSSSFSIDEIKKAELSDLKRIIDEDNTQNLIPDQITPTRDSAGALPSYTLNCSLKSVFFESNNSDQQSLGFELTDKQKLLFQSSAQSQPGSQSGSESINVKDIRVSNALTFVEKTNKIDSSNNPLYKVRTFYLSKEGMQEYEEMHERISNYLETNSSITSLESVNQSIKNVENEIINAKKPWVKSDFINYFNLQPLVSTPSSNTGSSTLDHSQSAHKILQHFIGKGLLKIPSAEVIRENQKFSESRNIFEPSDLKKDKGAVINTYKFDGILNLARDGNKIDKFKINDDGVKYIGIFLADAKTEIGSTIDDKFKSLKKYLKPKYFSKTNYQFFNYSDSKHEATLQEYNPNAPYNSLLKKTHNVKFEEITQKKADKLKIQSHNQYRETKPENSKKTKKFDNKNNSESLKSTITSSMNPIKEAILPTHKIKFLYQTNTDTSTSTLVGKSTNTNYYGYDIGQGSYDKLLESLSFKLISLPFSIAGATLSLIPRVDKFLGNHQITKSSIIDPEPITNTSDQQSTTIQVPGLQEDNDGNDDSQGTVTPLQGTVTPLQGTVTPLQGTVTQVSSSAGGPNQPGGEGQDQQGGGGQDQPGVVVDLGDVVLRDITYATQVSPKTNPTSLPSPHGIAEYSHVSAGSSFLHVSHVSGVSHVSVGDSSPGDVKFSRHPQPQNDFKRNNIGSPTLHYFQSPPSSTPRPTSAIPVSSPRSYSDREPLLGSSQGSSPR